MQRRFDAIVLAGANRDAPDPLAEQCGESNKALVKIGERPMVWYVLNALARSRHVGRVILVGLSVDEADRAGIGDGVAFQDPIRYLPDQGSLLADLSGAFQTLAQWQDHDAHALVLTSDTPLLTSEMIDWFLDHCRVVDGAWSEQTHKDIYWGIVERSVMESSFPEAKRTYMRLTEGQFCSGDIFLGRIKAALNAQGPVQEALDNRKNVLRQVRMLGFGNLVKYLVRRLSLSDLLEVVHRLYRHGGSAGSAALCGDGHGCGQAASTGAGPGLYGRTPESLQRSAFGQTATIIYTVKSGRALSKPVRFLRYRILYRCIIGSQTFGVDSRPGADVPMP